MKERNRIASIVSGKYYPLLLFVLSFVFVILFSRSTSFLYVFEGGDPAIFKQMGLALLRGKTLYVDYFDNKGCILYFIQALGLWLGGDFFILLMQAISLTITFIIWDKMLALYRNPKQRLICLGIALVLLLGFYQDGDLTEEWCLPFASYPLLLYFRSLKSGKEICHREVFVIGVCFGIIAFIRTNNASPFLGFVAYIWMFLLIKKDFGKLFKSLACFISGIAIVAGICVLYFYLKAGWYGVYEMVYATFLSNFEYLRINIGQLAILCVAYFLFVALCIIQQIINSAKDKEILIPALLSYGIFLISSGTRCFTHYLMTLLPLVIVLMITMPSKFHSKQNIVFGVLLFESVCFYLPLPLGFMVNDLIMKDDKYSVIYDNFHQCIEVIPKNERDSIYNFNLLGSGAGMMQHEGLLQCNRVFFSAFVFDLPTLNKEEMEKPLVLPKWLMVAWEYYYTEDDAYYILDHYDEMCSFEYNRIYLKKPPIGSSSTVYLYRRKN